MVLVVLARKARKLVVRSRPVSVLVIVRQVIAHKVSVRPVIDRGATTDLVVIVPQEIGHPVIANLALLATVNDRSEVVRHVAVGRIVVATNHHNRASSSVRQPSRRSKSH